MYIFSIFFKEKYLYYFFNYCLNNINLPRKNIINDLGVIFDSNPSFKNHVDDIKNKLYIRSGLIMQMCTDFKMNQP